jgi:N-acyl-D-amino-acid deacylase
MLSDVDGFYEEYGGSDRVVIAWYVPEPDFEGMSMFQIADSLNCTSAEAALRLYERDGGQVVVHAMNEDDLDLVASHPLISVASDGTSLSVEGILSAGRPHPRHYGTYPRFLAQFVREKKLVTLEEAVRRMTTLPASRMGVTRRGRIAPGFGADMVVFDPDTVADTATFESPHSYPVGIPHVAVNGVLVIEGGEFTGATPGKVVRDFGD